MSRLSGYCARADEHSECNLSETRLLSRILQGSSLASASDCLCIYMYIFICRLPRIGLYSKVSREQAGMPRLSLRPHSWTARRGGSAGETTGGGTSPVSVGRMQMAGNGVFEETLWQPDFSGTGQHSTLLIHLLMSVRGTLGAMEKFWPTMPHTVNTISSTAPMLVGDAWSRLKPMYLPLLGEYLFCLHALCYFWDFGPSLFLG